MLQGKSIIAVGVRTGVCVCVCDRICECGCTISECEFRHFQGNVTKAVTSFALNHLFLGKHRSYESVFG